MTERNENPQPTELLKGIHLPADLRLLDVADLPFLAQEIRDFLVESVSRTGGHLAAGLGVVELTLALHYVFNTPDDRLIWDVGHQAYPHKILTGRKQRMGTLRQKGGLSGFPRREESEYDTFGVGHSSTSISAALGMAVAAEKQGHERQIVAIIGDGALSAGMAFEALNHAGALDTDLLVILNDNDMSISSPVGAISKYLTKVLSSRFYNKMRDGSRSAFRSLPGVVGLMDRWEEHMKGMVIPGTLFEEMGFNYMGPIDGHDLPGLIETLNNLKDLKGPRFLHVVTQKGRGYEPAEGNPCFYHGVTPFDPDTGELASSKSAVTYTQVFSDWICDAAAADERLIGITPAMCEGSGLVDFSQQFANRYYDVAIAEQHAVTLAAGMACDGLKPVVAIYSTFLQRAYDQLIHDVALQNLDVTFAVDRAGVVGADGATHAGCFDLSYARCIPNMIVMAPADENECRQMLQTAYEYAGPALVRYPRGVGPGVPVDTALTTLPIGMAVLTRSGHSVALLAFGELHAAAQLAAEQLHATVVNMRFVKPLDADMLMSLVQNHDLLVTLEDNVMQGGAGSAVAEFYHSRQINTAMLQLGLPDNFIEHASQADQLQQAGLDVDSIVSQVSQHLSQTNVNKSQVL
ncbi:MAG: 1-deoxy-D-xylulose-5-phosphate synthase [Chromatiales bacterium]|jgi:1-deoxy-D-xylulose-5-phosphate synthase